MRRERERSARKRTAARRGCGLKRTLVGALAAVPVGLGLAAVLLVAAGPPSANPLIPGSATGTAAPGADEALPPTPDDFFDDRQGGPPEPGEPDPAGDAGDAGDGDAGAGRGEDEGAAIPDAVVEDDITVAPSQWPDEGEQAEEDADSGGGSPREPETGGGAFSGGDQVSALARQVVDLANEERAEAGCSPLRTDPRLRKASKAHARDMAERDYLAHESPEGKGPAERAREAGYDAWSGENIAAGYPSAESVMEAWMDSAGHRRNILDCGNTDVGVAETDGRWAQNFGTGE